MKKSQWNKLTYATVGVLAIFLCLALCFVGMWFEKGLRITTGRCIVSDGGTVLLIVEDGYSEGCPVTLSYKGSQQDPFGQWSTGDLVTVVHGLIAESYPGQTQAYYCWHKEDGRRSDIPENLLKDLTEMGWIKEPMTAVYEAAVEGKNVRICLEVPSLWQAEQMGYTGEEYTGCGLMLRSVNDPEVEVEVSYYPYGYAICGTGVEFEDITLNHGQPASLATQRQGSGIWVTMFLGDSTGDGSFVAQYHLTKEQKEMYLETIQEMLLTVEFQAE